MPHVSAATPVIACQDIDLMYSQVFSTCAASTGLAVGGRTTYYIPQHVPLTRNS